MTFYYELLIYDEPFWNKSVVARQVKIYEIYYDNEKLFSLAHKYSKTILKYFQNVFSVHLRNTNSSRYDDLSWTSYETDHTFQKIHLNF